MSINFTVQPSTRLVVYTVEGTPTGEDVREFFDAVIAHPDLEGGFGFLGDYRERASDPDPGYVRLLAREIRVRAQQIAPCRWAMIVKTASGFASARLCGLLTYGTDIEIAPFLTPEEAAAWVEEAADERLPFAVSC